MNGIRTRRVLLLVVTGAFLALGLLLAVTLLGDGGPAGPDGTVGPGGTATASPSTATPSASTATIDVYFGRSDLDPCTQVVPVERTVGTATPEAAIRALLAGPTSEEAAAGYQSWFSASTADALDSVAVADGVVRVSFHDLRTLIPNASSSCGSGMLLGALDATLAQFPGISAVRYSIEGDEAAFYEWLQRGVPEG